MTPAELVAFQAEINTTQVGLAEILGVSRETIIRWQRGRTRIPRAIDLAVATVRRHRAAMAGNHYPLMGDVYRVMVEEGLDERTAVHSFGVCYGDADDEIIG